MINLKRILVPTDFSESARHAFTYGCSFAREYKAELLLLHVVENLTVGYASDLFPVPMAEVFDEISGYARAELAKLGAQAKEKGVAARELVVQGKPSARSRLPTVSRACITASLAPPWSGPFKVAMAAVTAPCMSARVEAATRAAKVEALNSWSACRTKATSMARSAVAEGRAPWSM